MALSKVTEVIRDGINTGFKMVWAKLGSTPTAAIDTDIVVPAHALLDTTEALIDPATSTNQTAQSTLFGALTETAPATDTASSGLNGRLQRIAQRITSMIALLPSALGSGGGLKVDGSGTALPVSQSGTWTVQPGNTANTTAWKVDGSAVTQPTKYTFGAAQLVHTRLNLTSSGDNNAVVGAAAQSVHLYAMQFTVDADCTVTIKADGSTTLAAYDLRAYGSLTLDMSAEPWFTSNGSANLIINLSAAVNLKGFAKTLTF